jgi:riboflavin kinase / FMN adenylyltransferase
MHVLSAQSPVPSNVKRSVVAIGNFDGVHRGHQELLNVAKRAAEKLGTAWGILTFEPHPRSFFKPNEPVFRLTPAPLKEKLVAAMGADFMLTLQFDASLANQDHEDFIRQILVEKLGVAHVVTGYDFHFGKGRRGNPDSLARAGEQHGFAVTSVEQVSDDGDAPAHSPAQSRSPFSSSSVRTSLRRGHLREAARELGYFWMVMGEVVPGDQRGRTIGFPTANIVLESGAEPSRGIFAVMARDVAGGPSWMGAGYFGDRPTFNTNRTFLEVYLLDQDIDLYGRTLEISFIDLIRGDKSFKSVEELIAQMKMDCEQARLILQRLATINPVTEFPLGKLQAQQWTI